MSRHSLFAVTVISAVAFGSAGASAQQAYNPYAGSQLATPMSPAHKLAALSNEPGVCGLLVDKAADNVSLRIQGMDGMSSRLHTNALLEAARNAADAGDEEACWHWYDRAQN